MASSGEFWKKPASGHDFGLKCVWTSTGSASGNYTDISITAYLNVYNIDIGARTDNVMTINGTATTFSSPALSRSGASSYTLKQLNATPITTRVYHNANGTKTGVSLKCDFHYNGKWSGVTYTWITATATVDLDPFTVYRLSISAGSNSAVTVNRTESGYGSTGNLSNGATLYSGDKLRISFSASTGYGVGTHTVNGSSFTSGNTHTVSDNVSVVSTAVALASTVSATNANIGGTSSITVTKGNSSYAHSLYFSFGSSSPVTGYIKSDGTVSATEVKYTNTSVSFSVPTSFYAKIPSAKSGTCTITCKTYSSASSSTQIGSSQTCTFTATAAESSCKPTVSGTVVDTNTATTALTGDSSKLVRYKSTATATISATAKNSSTISSEKINNSAANSSHQRVFTQTSVSSFTFQATDSRGYSNSYTVNPTVVPYVLLTANPVVKRTSATGSTMTLSVSGNVFVGNFGAQTNSVEVWCRYKLSSEASYPAWNEATHKITSVTYGTNTYRVGTITLSGTFDYQESYDFDIWVGDKLSSMDKYVTVSRGVPVFDWGKSSFRVNGDAIGTIYGLAGAGISIPSGTDLDIYTEPGVYAVESNDVAASLTNCPSVLAGTLRIWSSNGRSGPVTESWRYRCEEYTDLHMNVWRRSGFTGNVSGDYSQYPERPFAWNADWTPVDVSESYTATEGTWTYRRFASGDVILWGKFTVTPTQEAQTGGLYYSQTVYINLPFPVTNAAVTGSAQNLYFVANAGVNSSSATSNPNTVWFRLLHATTISGNQTVDLHVCGKWK